MNTGYKQLIDLFRSFHRFKKSYISTPNICIISFKLLNITPFWNTADALISLNYILGVRGIP